MCQARISLSLATPCTDEASHLCVGFRIREDFEGAQKLADRDHLAVLIHDKNHDDLVLIHCTIGRSRAARDAFNHYFGAFRDHVEDLKVVRGHLPHVILKLLPASLQGDCAAIGHFIRAT